MWPGGSRRGSRHPWRLAVRSYSISVGQDIPLIAPDRMSLPTFRNDPYKRRLIRQLAKMHGNVSCATVASRFESQISLPILLQSANIPLCDNNYYAQYDKLWICADKGYRAAGRMIPLHSPNPTRCVFVSLPPQAVKLISSSSSTKKRVFPSGVLIA